MFSGTEYLINVWLFYGTKGILGKAVVISLVL